MAVLSIDTPVGVLRLTAHEGALVSVEFARSVILSEAKDLEANRHEILRFAQDDANKQSMRVLEQTACQLQEYFEGTRRVFDLPTRAEGTPFQQRVWEALRQISYGQTRTYGQIAAAIGAPRAARAVGGACNRNPLAIVVPCHRVVGVGGLTGFAGGIPAKEFLLSVELPSLRGA